MTIVQHTDPISGHEGKAEFSHQEGSGDFSLEIHFESETNRQAYRDIPVEPSSLDFDNPEGEGYDEG